MGMREEIVDLLVRLRMLRVIPDLDEEFDRIALVGEVAHYAGATAEELGEALRRVCMAGRGGEHA